MAHELIGEEYYKQALIDYDVCLETGKVFRKTPCRGVRVGKECGYLMGIEGNKYLCISVTVGNMTKHVRIHKIVWYKAHGTIPLELDHENLSKLDNKLSNLRIATRSEQLQNTKIGNNNKSGHKGVYWHKKSKKWMSYIKFNGKSKYLGIFENKEDAAAARKAAVEKYFNQEYYRDE